MEIESLADIWEAICEECKKEINEIAFRVWFKDLEPVDIQNGVLTLSIYSSYKKEIVENTYSDLIKKSIKAIMGIDMDFKIIATDSKGPGPEILGEGGYSEENFTFDNFIVGQTNRFAHAAAQAVAEKPAYEYNPLVIYGPSGVGKTHLLFAIKNEISRLHPQLKIECTRGEEFTNDLIHALHDNKMRIDRIDDFRNKYRNVDVLLIDDIHFIAGKESTQEEFFNTFEFLKTNNKQVVVTLDRPPKMIMTLENRIKTRLEDGLLADITPADFETRVGIIRVKCEQAGITLSDEVVYEIAKKVNSSNRQLGGVVKKLKAYINLEKKAPTVSVLKTLIRDVIAEQKAEPIKIERIIEEVARTYQVSQTEILSSRRTAELVKARQIAMYIARETTELAYQSIGESFGKDHSTVLHNVRQAEKVLKDNPYEKEIVDEIIRNLKEE